MEDTIAAISTPPGEGGIGIVRISGKDALAIADRVFVCKTRKKPSRSKSFTTHYGWIKDIDEVILTVMRAPKTYTKEDIVEINCHSGIAPLRKTLELVLKEGARLAEPGEFTKRAFLNGRIDLAQAEAVCDIVKSKTEGSLRQAALQLKGKLSDEIRDMSSRILDVLAHLEASLDFPDEDIETDSKKKVLRQLKGLISDTERLYESASYGIIMKEGALAVIAGRPNVGKSSLLNALLKRERAIVTDIPGTTTDTIEETVNIKGVPVRLVDTAGILSPKDAIHKQAVKKAHEYFEAADVVLLVLDASQAFKPKDKVVINAINKKPFITVLNKIDLPKKIKAPLTLSLSPKGRGKKGEGHVPIEISATKGTGLSKLETALAKVVLNGSAPKTDEAIITSARHKEAIRTALDALKDARSTLKQGLSEEFAAQHLKDALDELSTITGESVKDNLLDRIFSEFCIGK